MTESGLTPTGILGASWRAAVTSWGDVRFGDGSAPLSWAVAAEDRWHFPESETTTRQMRVRGTPVTETRVRVPSGDVVQHVWSASSSGDCSAVLMEFTNDSPLPVAISLSRADVVTPRSYHRADSSDRPWPSQDRGVERPPLIIPLGHRARMRVALARTGVVDADDVGSFPDWETVVRGWVNVTDGASRLEVPDLVDGVLLEDVVRARRSDIALSTRNSDPSIADDPASWILVHHERVRMSLTEIDVPSIVTALERLLRVLRKQGRWDAAAADALRTGAMLLGASDSRALRDFERAVQRALRRRGLISRGDQDVVGVLASVPRTKFRKVSDGDATSATESEFAIWSAHDEVTLMPWGFDETRLGVNVEVHRIPAGPHRTVSLAIRWHGERPAVIWEVDGPPGLVLRSGADSTWSSVEPAGEALWNVPAVASVSG